MTKKTWLYQTGIPSIALAAMLLMLAFGCVKSGADITGILDNAKVQEVVEFKQDGTGVFTYPDGKNPPLAFTWKRSVNNSYTLDVDFIGTKRTLIGTVQDKFLQIESTMGKELYNKRVNR